jgi:hypothetical protein
MTSVGAADTERAQSASLGQPLERIGWALFLVMIGGLALFPSGLVPEGTWLAGTGLIMIGLNIARHLKGVRISSFDLPVLPTLLAAIGLQTLYSVLLSRRGTP